MARSLDSLEEFVTQRIISDGWTHKALSEHLTANYPSSRGFSVRSIERFCSERNIRRTSRLTKQEVEESVEQAVLEVLYYYTNLLYRYSNNYVLCLIILHNIREDRDIRSET